MSILAPFVFFFGKDLRAAGQQPSGASWSHVIRAIVARSDEPFPQPKKTFAAFPSGDRCLGHPKVKLFALERSPNVSHATNIAQSTQTHAGYLCHSELISCILLLQQLLALLVTN
jgi:hypothetical protein